MIARPEFIADIRFHRTDEGGRQGPTGAEWFGCPLEYDGAFFDCRIDLSTHGPVRPGDRLQVPVVMLFPELVLPRLSAGAVFTLWEGRTIASGTVARVLWVPDFVADIRFYRTDEGGRQWSTPESSFRPAVVFEGRYHDCWLDLSEHGVIRPGDEVRLSVTLYRPDRVLPRLEPGAKFTLWEHGTIASGEVVHLPGRTAS